MRTYGTHVDGVVPIEGKILPDSRGSFVRLGEMRELRKHGFRSETSALLFATNLKAGTVRGMHFQAAPSSERKLVWCVSGAAYDVLLDARPGSHTYGNWVAFRLSPDEPLALLVPPGVAHGYQTLMDHSTICYMIDGKYEPLSARSVRWDDPSLAIEWPVAMTAISDQDKGAGPWPPDSF